MQENYNEALKFLVNQMLSRRQGTEEQQIRSNNESVYMYERILIELFDESLDNLRDNFNGCQLEECLNESKDLIVYRIRSIIAVHKVRNILAKQCFIGLTGPQNSGKSSLIKSIWNLDVIVGEFKHTTKATAFQITENVMVVDYPGITSLEHYKTAFKRSGSMNNVLVAVIKYPGGAPDQQIIDSVEEIYTTVQKSRGMKVLLCFNRCSSSYDAWMEENLTIEDIKTRYVTDLTAHVGAGNEGGVSFVADDIRFTDWKVTADQLNFGILGSENIKQELKTALQQLQLVSNREANEAFP